jgi:glycosyltransferase involved in cell wall biosynthesis
LASLSFRVPYIVSSRINSLLRKNLLKDEYPILLEGIHCSYLLNDAAFANRKIGVRVHNVEFIYYRQLHRTAVGIFKKMYYLFECKLLKKYEFKIAKKARLLTLTQEDAHIYRRVLGARDVSYFPMVIPFSQINIPEGLGYFCLYHGNLSVPENEKAACWLAEKVFLGLDIPFVVAGKGPSDRLKKIMSDCKQSKLIQDPSNEELNDLISDAQINVLPSFNSTGVKLKLLNALFNGRHCVVNAAMGCASETIMLCHIADDPIEFKNLIKKLFSNPLSEKEIRTRQEVLQSVYDNITNSQYLVQWLY